MSSSDVSSGITGSADEQVCDARVDATRRAVLGSAIRDAVEREVKEALIAPMRSFGIATHAGYGAGTVSRVLAEPGGYASDHARVRYVDLAVTHHLSASGRTTDDFHKIEQISGRIFSVGKRPAGGGRRNGGQTEREMRKELERLVRDVMLRRSA